MGPKGKFRDPKMTLKELALESLSWVFKTCAKFTDTYGDGQRVVKCPGRFRAARDTDDEAAVRAGCIAFWGGPLFTHLGASSAVEPGGATLPRGTKNMLRRDRWGKRAGRRGRHACSGCGDTARCLMALSRDCSS